jgi:hypothetical protein
MRCCGQFNKVYIPYQYHMMESTCDTLRYYQQSNNPKLCRIRFGYLEFTTEAANFACFGKLRS